jgi:hypothetical protein
MVVALGWGKELIGFHIRAEKEAFEDCAWVGHSNRFFTVGWEFEVPIGVK